MRILVVSDTHGRHMNLRRILELVEPDKVYHLGDSEGFTDEITKAAGVPCEFVEGNCDGYSGMYLPGFLVMKVGNHNALLCHGHQLRVKYGPETLVKFAKEKGCDIALYGHTHIPHLEVIDGVTVMNPGSCSQPRQDGRKISYGVLLVDDQGDVDFAIRYLED